MATTTTPLQEKLTLFWHGHFATANYKVDDARLMYLQNALFRSMATGNFRDLVQQMSLQPAMLIWLDNEPNTKRHPNENFARELMELFTLGVGNYTQDDVVASARAWTGHNTLDSDRTQYHFYPTRHDTGLEDVHGCHPELGRPRHHQLPPPRRPDAQVDRGHVHRAEDVELLRVSRSRRRDRHDARDRVRRAPTLSIAELVRAIFNHPAFLSPAAKQGLVRSPDGVDRRVHAGRQHQRDSTPTRSGGWKTWASSCSSRPTCRAGDRTTTGSRPRGCGRARTGRDTSSGGTARATR